MVKFKSLDFSLLHDADLNYVLQTSVSTYKAGIFLACAIHYKFELPSVIRFKCGNYTSAYQDVDDIIATLTSDGCNKSLVNKIKRIMSVDYSVHLNAYSSQENFQAFSKYGNHTTIINDILKILHVINNETKHCYDIPFPRWIITLCPNIHLTP